MNTAPLEHFIGTSPAMQEIYRTLAKLTQNDLTVTITGEIGTGKELIARALHQLGKRKNAPFVIVHMAAIPPDILENELFGKGGKFAQAQGGTLFLDEISDMTMDAQSRLFRVIQQGEFATGGRMVKTDMRIVCSTYRDLLPLMAQGLFREDLYYRLNVIPLAIPPLRSRREDIAPLAQYFLRKAVEQGMPPKILDAETIAAMQEYDWPGNVRELEQMMLRLCTLCPDSIIGKAAFLSEIRRTPAQNISSSACTLEKDVANHLKQYFSTHSKDQLPPPGLYSRILPLLEKPLIQMTLEATGGNQVKAAFVLGINRNTLRKKIAELAIKDSDR